MRPTLIPASAWLSLSVLCLCTTGCPTPSTPEEVERFRQAGPLQLATDRDALADARLPAGLYRPVPGDILELVMPAILQEVSARRIRDQAAELIRPQSHLCRVREDGVIILPIVGDLDVRGKSLPEIEGLATAAYFPRYVRERPSIVATVRQYRTSRVSILGAVNGPGVYELQSNEMSLVALLMKAGGIDMKGATGGTVGGASVVRIRKADTRVPLELAFPAAPTTDRPADVPAANGPPDRQSPDAPPANTRPAPAQSVAATLPAEPGRSYAMVLPIEGMNIPFADVPLAEGDIVEVEGLKPEVFTVIGLVNKAGAFPYPPGARYNLLQALSFAAGLNDIADPQYAKIYRQDVDGTIIEGVFKVKGSNVASAASIPIKPGDVIAVEHTAMTRFNLVLSEVLRINAGVNLNASYTIWNPYNYDNSNSSLANDVFRSATPSIISTILGG